MAVVESLLGMASLGQQNKSLSSMPEKKIGYSSGIEKEQGLKLLLSEYFI